MAVLHSVELSLGHCDAMVDNAVEGINVEGISCNEDDNNDDDDNNIGLC